MRNCFLLTSIFFILLSHNAFSSNYLIINNISIVGNKTTKSYVILRELTFKRCDSIAEDAIDEQLKLSRENLLNTSLFNFVTIDKQIEGELLNITITVVERWYTWPSIVLQYADRNFAAWLRNGNLQRTKIGFAIDRYNFLGRSQHLMFSMVFGYVNQFILSYRNIAIDKDKKQFIGADFWYSQQDELIYNTKNNKPEYFKFAYQPVYQEKKIFVNYTYRPYFYGQHNFFINYLEYNIADTISKLNKNFFDNQTSRKNYLKFDYIYSYDRRDSKAYPLHGFFYSLDLDEINTLPLSSSAYFSNTIYSDLYWYDELTPKIFYAGAFNFKVSATTGDSYFIDKALGYYYNMHGFEYNIIDGQHFVMFRNLIKFNLIPTRASDFKFLLIPKFSKIHYALYANLFADCGYVSSTLPENGNTYANKFLYSGGVGLDLVTYYDLTLRFEYSVTRFGVQGFYINLSAPINK